MTFDSATAVQRADDATWTGEIQPGWDIFENANGGYLMAIAARAMSAAADGRLPVSVTAHFTRPGKPGPVTIGTEIVRAGRTFSTVRADLSSESGLVLDRARLIRRPRPRPGDSPPHRLGDPGPATAGRLCPSPSRGRRSTAAATGGQGRGADPPR